MKYYKGKYKEDGKRIPFDLNANDMGEAIRIAEKKLKPLQFLNIIEIKEVKEMKFVKSERVTCNHPCSPSDFYEGGKCDKMGCYPKKNFKNCT